MTAATAKQERIGARMPRDVYEPLTRAAELTGATVNQFLVKSALPPVVHGCRQLETGRGGFMADRCWR